MESSAKAWVFGWIAWVMGGVASPASTRWEDLTEEGRAELMEVNRAYSLPRRLVENSRHFLGTAYLSSPLGEGQGKDADPLIRFDAVDCLTLVEETMALSLASKADEVEPVLSQLRYAKETTFDDRNHLMEAQWIPHNAEKGFLRDITRRIAGSRAIAVQKTISRSTWLSKSSRALGLARERQPIGTFRLEIVPLDEVVGIAERIPNGTILLVVREDLPYKVTRISHLGFVLHVGARTYLRHASASAHRVVDEELSHFLHRNFNYEKWRVTGVSLFEAREP